MKVIYGTNQADFSAAESTEIATVVTVEEARAVIRKELGVAALRRERLWHNPADHVVEGWVVDLHDENCSNGYFIVRD